MPDDRPADRRCRSPRTCARNDRASKALGMRIVAISEGARVPRDDGARRHAERLRHLPRRLHHDARRLGVRVRLQLARRAHGRGRASTVDFLAPAQRGDVLTARAFEVVAGRPHRRLRHRRSRNQRGERVALVRGRSHTAEGPAACCRRRGHAAMPVRRRPRRPAASSSRSSAPAATSCRRCSSSACAGRCGTPTTTSPHYRRAFDAQGRAPGRPEVARRPRAVSRSPSRRTCATTIRSACSRCRASRWCASTRRRARPASRPSSATRSATSTPGPTSSRARSAPPAAGPATWCHVAYGYGLFTGGLGAHYGAERARLHGDPDVGRPDREAGAADPRLRSPTSSWSRRRTCRC